MIQQPFEKIDKTAIESLIANNVSESRTLDYKEILPTDTKEFLADVSSFANASGGDLIFGVKEEQDANGEKTGNYIACGLSDVNADKEILRLENIIRDGVEPRITGIRTKEILGFPNGAVIVMRVPKSWASPHMLKSSSRFYSRNSRGKYPLDVQEIRSAFALSDALPERIRRFRDDRLAKIIADETPVPLSSGTRAILHIIPISSLDPTTIVNIASIAELNSKLMPLGSIGWDGRYNFDGYVTFTQTRDNGGRDAYVQLFRNGAIEAVSSRMCCIYGNQKLIPSVAYEKDIIEGTLRYLNALQALMFEPPLFVILSLVGVNGYTMSVDTHRYWVDRVVTIDRDALLVPEIIVESYEANVASLLRPVFDAVWQACGWNKSLNYDSAGNWKPNA